MSKSDLLGSLVRAVVGVPVQRLGTLLDTVQKVSKANAWGQLAQFNKTVVASAVAASFITSDYFTTRPENKIWMSEEFTQRITYAYPDPIPHRGLEGITHFQSKPTDAKNITEMGGEADVRRYAFTPDQIAELRDKQLNGEEGQLLTNGYWNLFYVIGKDGLLFVVGVGWDSGVRSWRVDAWRLDEDDYWVSDDRVFRNTLVLEA
jgi:hypothetical protein